MPLDIGLGLILGVLLSSITSLSYGLCLGIGVTATLLPDIDYIWMAISKKVQPDSRHRDLLHYPLLFLPTIGLVGFVFSKEITIILTLGALLHFIHDSFGVGFGIKWLFPFKRNSYLFFFQTSTPNNRNMPKPENWFYSWTDKERNEMIKKYAYPGWIKHIYFSIHPFGIFEYSFLVVGIIVAFIYS